MKILLTGPDGNLGQALQRQGQRHVWVGLGRGQWGELSHRIRLAEVVIHAASDLVTPPWQKPRQIMESNLLSTLRLLEVIRAQKIRRFVFTSSCAVYGRSEQTSEAVTPAPISINGITKLLNEELIREFCTRHAIPYQILRVFNTYGGNDRFSILSHLQRSLREKQPFTMYNDGISQRDFIHVDDIARVCLALLERPLIHPVLNIGTGNVTRIRDIVEAFRIQHPELTVVDDQRPEAEYSRADIRKLRELLPTYAFHAVLDFLTAGAVSVRTTADAVTGHVPR